MPGGFINGGFNIGRAVFPVPFGSFSGILDEVEGAVFAIAPYSRLSRTQTQSIEVRETGGDTEEIFGPESQAAIEAFVVPAEVKALYNERMYFDGVDDQVGITEIALTGDFKIKWTGIVEGTNRFLGKTGESSFKFNSSTAAGFNFATSFENINTTEDVGIDELKTFTIARESGVLKLYNEAGVNILGTNITNTDTFNLAKFGAGRNEYSSCVLYDIEVDTNGDGTFDHQWNGYGNTNADWEDQIGTNDGTVSGSPALFTGQGFDGRIATAYNQGSEAADAVQATAANQPFIATAGVTETGMRFDGSDDHFTFTLAAPVTGTIIVGTTEGIYAAESTLAAGTYSLTAKGFTGNFLRSAMNVMTSAILFNRTLSSAEIAKVKAAMVAGGAVESFGAVANFFRAWYQCTSLTSFPLIDTSGGTSFVETWNDNRLTSFPLLNTSSGTHFGAAWLDNNLLEDFPANFFDAWNPASITSGVFNNTWVNCTSLTSTSVENILVSLDTSGKYGTNTGLSTGTVLANNNIDIDYDGSGLTAATTTAITNLKAKDWQVNINGVLQ